MRSAASAMSFLSLSSLYGLVVVGRLLGVTSAQEAAPRKSPSRPRRSIRLP